MKKIRLGIIGTGSIAQSAHLPNLSKFKEFELVGACDRHRSRLNGVAEKYGIDIRETNYESLLKRDDIDAVLISTPNDSHLEIGLTAIEAGKHVLIEKPLAKNVEEAEAFVKAVKKAETIFMVGMNHRFRLDLVTLKNMISQNELGKIYSMNVGWLNHQSTDQQWTRRKDRAGGGVLMDLGLVMIDVITWLLDFPEVESISTSFVKNTTTSVEDAASCFIRLRGGTSVQLNVSWSTVIERPSFYIDIFGTDGSASVNPLRIHKVIAGTPANVTPILKGSTSSIYQRSYGQELRHFAGAISGAYPPVSSAEEALHRMRIIDAAYKSAELNKEIKLA